MAERAKQTKSLSKNFRVTAVVAIVCLFLWLLVWYSTKHVRNQILGELPEKAQFVGEIIQAEHKVLKNFSGRLTWQSVEPGDAIHLGNSIQTLENSKTILQLSDGQRVDISANSLIRIQNSENGLSLELIDGDIQLETIQSIGNQNSLSGIDAREKSPIEFKIKTKDGYLKTRNSSLKISQKKNSKESPKIEVYKGSVTSVTEKGAEAEMKLPIVQQAAKEIAKVETAVKKSELLEVNEAGQFNPVTEAEIQSLGISPKTLAVNPSVDSLAEVQAPTNLPLPQPRPAPGPSTTLKAGDRMPSSQKVKTKSSRKEKSLPLPEKKPLQAPKIKRVDVKVVE